MNVLHVRSQIARLPIIVIGIVSDLIVPEPVRILKVQSLRIRQRAHLQIKVVAVLSAVIEPLHIFRRKGGALLRPEECVKTEISRKHKRAAVIGVVAHEKICHRRFRRSRFNRRVRVDDAG